MEVVDDKGNIHLLPHQVDSYKHSLKILKDWFVTVNSSRTGAGKTILTLAIARTLGMDLLLVVPPTLQDPWKESAAKLGVNVFMCLSYDQLRGSKGRQLKHGIFNLLTRDEDDNFLPTEDFKEVLKTKKLLIVFDEFHKVKNVATQQLESCHVLIRCLVSTPETLCRSILLSATPGDKEEHALSFLKMLGIVHHRNLYEIDKGILRPTGFHFIYNLAKKVDKLVLDQIMPGGLESLQSRNAMKMTFEIYTKIFRDKYTSCMSPPGITAKKMVKAGFYSFPPEDDKILQDAYDSLRQSMKTDDNDEGLLTSTKSTFSRITKAFVKMEIAKVRTMVRLALEYLNGKNNKVIMYFSYKQSIEGAARLLTNFNPLILDGSIPKDKRKLMVDCFQQNNSNYKLMISQYKVGGVGLSLDDITGEYPRTQLFAPSHSMIEIEQASGRTLRATTKSDALNLMVFSKNVKEEINIIDSLARKASATKSYRTEEKDEEGQDKVLYPGEYPSFIEKKNITSLPYSIKFDDSVEQ